ncbi:MAG: hypothetical protein AB7K09_05505 [Planctomycetota bacterium]
MPGLLTLFRDRGESLRGMVVDTVLWCGVCNPKRYPVNLDVIDPAPLIDGTRSLATGPPSSALIAAHLETATLHARPPGEASQSDDDAAGVPPTASEDDGARDTSAENE